MGTTAGQPGSRAGQGAGAFGQPAGGGEPAAGQGQGAGGGPAGSGGSTEPGAGGVGAGEFNRDELNPALRGLNPNQINELFGALLTRGGQPAEPAEPRRPEPEPLPDINLREVMDPTHESYNPELALKWFVQKNYGGLMQDINQRSIKGLYGNFRNQIHDFAEYEQDIDKALSQRDPSTLSERDIFGTYLAMKGMRQLAKERTERATTAGRSTHQPSAPKDDQIVDEALDATETEFAKIMFPNEADPTKRYQEMKKKVAGGPFELQVPIGDGKKA